MGFSPNEVDRMSLFKFLACCDGVALANGAKRRGEEVSNDDLAAMGIEGF